MLLFLLLMFVIGSGALFRLTLSQHFQLREHARRAALPANAGRDDEEVINYLEASATVSSTAQRALAALQGGQKLLEGPKPAPKPEAPSGPPAWAHDADAVMLPTERWGLFLADLDREPDDEERAKVVANWLNDGERFTLWERGQILDRIEDSEYRHAIRTAFVEYGQPAEPEKKKPPAEKPRARAARGRGLG